MTDEIYCKICTSVVVKFAPGKLDQSSNGYLPTTIGSCENCGTQTWYGYKPVGDKSGWKAYTTGSDGFLDKSGT